MTLRVNDYLRQMFYIMGIDLVDFKIEYGYTAHGELLLADEISPDSMRLWKIGGDERFDIPVSKVSAAVVPIKGISR